MTENISNLKKHTCPTCGGQLIVNEVRRMYECPFCGVTFDYEYFREDDVLERAARSMRAGEMKSAQEAYEFMLAKEPSNFEALRGMILVAAGAKSTYEFARVESLKKMNTSLVDERVQNAIDNCLPEHKEYFLKMKELFDATDTYEDGLMKNRDLRIDQKKEISELQRVADKKCELFFEFRASEDPDDIVQVHPRSIAFLLITVYVFYCFFVLLGFGMVKNNPYTKTASTSKKTSVSVRTATNDSVSNYVVRMSMEKDLIKTYENQGMDPTEASKKAKEQMNKLPNYQSMNVYSSLDARKEKEAAESESKRKENEKAWEKRHANDGTKELLWILIPGAAVTLICIYLFRRENKIKRFDGEMLAPYREKASAITGEILKNEDSTNRMKFKLNQLYKEMKALDPIPEKVSPPTTIKLHKKQRKRWE